VNEPSLRFERLTDPSAEIAARLRRWENDPALVPLIRPSKTRQEQEEPYPVTVETLTEQLEKLHIYLIYRGSELVGEMSYQVDPEYLLKKVAGTAWIGILIGEPQARGQGIGSQAIQHLEGRIGAAGLKRIELGVFEFNQTAISLYRKLGYQEIGRLDEFTYWQGRMWQDIRMEKYLQ
jgi:RimJ/RimL family protein N-acetyltransferase